MALSFPLSAAAFADLLSVESVTFRLELQQQSQQAAGGEVLYADRAPARWIADITTTALTHADAASIKALINALAGGLNSFYLYDHSKAYPRQDPAGAGWSGATPVVGTITNRTVLAFTGFPNNYVLKRGDMLQIIYGSSRRYLGMFAEDKTANGSGAVAAVSVTPALPASVATSDAVTVIKPAGKFKLIPNSLAPVSVGINFERLSFQAQQTSAA